MTSLVSKFRPCWCSRTVLHPRTCRFGRSMLSHGATETSRKKLMPRVMSGSMDLWRTGFGVMSMASVVTKGSVDVCYLASHI